MLHHHGPARADLVIPAGDPNYESRASFTFKEDSHIWVMPHMHARDYKYTLVLPDGSSKVLLNVLKYDFNWQLNYWLKTWWRRRRAAGWSVWRITTIRSTTSTTRIRRRPCTGAIKPGEEMMIGWFDYTVDSQDLRKETALLK